MNKNKSASLLMLSIFGLMLASNGIAQTATTATATLKPLGSTGPSATLYKCPTSGLTYVNLSSCQSACAQANGGVAQICSNTLVDPK